MMELLMIIQVFDIINMLSNLFSVDLKCQSASFFVLLHTVHPTGPDGFCPVSHHYEPNSPV